MDSRLKGLMCSWAFVVVAVVMAQHPVLLYMRMTGVGNVSSSDMLARQTDRELK